MNNKRVHATQKICRIFFRTGQVNLTVEFFAFNTKLPEMATLASQEFTAAKKNFQWSSTC